MSDKPLMAKATAVWLVDNTTISFKQIAYLLGYSEVSAFYHAFRRWSGASPLQHKLAS